MQPLPAAPPTITTSCQAAAAATGRLALVGRWAAGAVVAGAGRQRHRLKRPRAQRKPALTSTRFLHTADHHQQRRRARRPAAAVKRDAGSTGAPRWASLLRSFVAAGMQQPQPQPAAPQLSAPAPDSASSGASALQAQQQQQQHQLRAQLQLRELSQLLRDLAPPGSGDGSSASSQQADASRTAALLLQLRGCFAGTHAWQALVDEWELTGGHLLTQQLMPPLLASPTAAPASQQQQGDVGSPADVTHTMEAGRHWTTPVGMGAVSGPAAAGAAAAGSGAEGQGQGQGDSMQEAVPGTATYDWRRLHTAGTAGAGAGASSSRSDQQGQQQQEVAPAATVDSSEDGGSRDGSSDSGSDLPPLKYEWLVLGGGGARCFAYAGALHALKQLGMLGRLRGVSGSSGGAVYALLAALDFSVAGVWGLWGCRSACLCACTSSSRARLPCTMPNLACTVPLLPLPPHQHPHPHARACVQKCRQRWATCLPSLSCPGWASIAGWG